MNGVEKRNKKATSHAEKTDTLLPHSLYPSMREVIILDAKHARIQNINARFAGELGFSTDQIIGKSLDDLPFENGGKISADLLKALEKKKTARFSDRLLNMADGHAIRVNLTARWVKTEQGKIIQCKIVESDAHHHDREALLDSEERYRNLFNTMLEGFALHEIILDEQNRPVDYRFMDINPAFEYMTGLRVEAALGKTVREVIPNIEQYWIDTYGKVALTGESIQFDNYAEGLERHFHVVAFSPRKHQFATIFTDITEQKRSEEKIQQQLDHLKALSEIDHAINASFDVHLSLKTLLLHVVNELKVDAACVLLFDPVLNALVYSEGRGFRNKTVEKTVLPLGEGYAGVIATKRRMMVFPNASEQCYDPLLDEVFAAEGFVQYFGAPVITKGQIKGVLEVYQRKPTEPEAEWFTFLNALAEQGAIAIENATLFENLERSNTELSIAYDATIEGWSRALDLRDKETEGHTRRVTDITLKLARAIHLSESELVDLRRGALLHDIGKMGVPDQILLKPGPLTPEEWVVMKKHPVLALEMLSPIRYLRPSLDIPYCHHEKWDGSGYPRGLVGEQIPLAARIFAVVDVWDALNSDRPYRKAWPREKILEYIRSESEKHFDPFVVSVFLESGLFDQIT